MALLGRRKRLPRWTCLSGEMMLFYDNDNDDVAIMMTYDDISTVMIQFLFLTRSLFQPNFKNILSAFTCPSH